MKVRSIDITEPYVTLLRSSKTSGSYEPMETVFSCDYCADLSGNNGWCEKRVFCLQSRHERRRSTSAGIQKRCFGS